MVLMSDGKSFGSVSGLHLQWAGRQFELRSLQPYGFSICLAGYPGLAARLAEKDLQKGVVAGAGDRIEVSFRFRRMKDDEAFCGFHDLSIEDSRRLQALWDNRGGGDGDDGLQSLSYDELAEGKSVRTANAPKAGQSGRNDGAGNKEANSALTKMLVSIMLAAAMVVIAGWVVFMIRSRTTIDVAGGVLMGNYQPVSAPVEGRLASLRVKVGDRVHPGQVLGVISSSKAAIDLGLLESKVERARLEIDAYRQLQEDIRGMLDISRRKIAARRAVALAERKRLEGELRIARASYRRLGRLIRAGNVNMERVEKLRSTIASLSGELEVQNRVLAGLEVDEQAASQNVIVSDGRILDPLAEARVKMSLARAGLKELEASRQLLLKKAGAAELVAPVDGKVTAIYRHPGDILKVADEALAISRKGSGWAVGHVPVADAADIRPGLPVEVSIPGYGMEIKGVVEGIGHRALYGRGRYSADFRTTPQEVPVRVALEKFGKTIPAGQHLNMTIRLRDPLKGLKNWISGAGQAIAGLFSGGGKSGRKVLARQEQAGKTEGRVSAGTTGKPEHEILPGKGPAHAAPRRTVFRIIRTPSKFYAVSRKANSPANGQRQKMPMVKKQAGRVMRNARAGRKVRAGGSRLSQRRGRKTRNRLTRRRQAARKIARRKHRYRKPRYNERRYNVTRKRRLVARWRFSRAHAVRINTE